MRVESVAATESHLLAAHRILDSGVRWGLVMEDDVIAVSGFERHLRHAMRIAPADAWLLQLGHSSWGWTPQQRAH